tara:strand:- start:3064 stop:3201 length:138 start_codon:yes stop_codon:yes gene_type:complete
MMEGDNYEVYEKGLAYCLQGLHSLFGDTGLINSDWCGLVLPNQVK